MKLARPLRNTNVTTVLCRSFGAELAQNEQIIANYRKLNHTSGKLNHQPLCLSISW